MKNLKNYAFILIALCYFGIYFVLKNEYYTLPFQDYITNYINTNYTDIIISFINAIFALILFFYFFNIFQDKIEDFIDKSVKGFKFKIFISELFKKFINISKYIISIYIAVNVAIIPIKLQSIVDKIFNVSFLIALLFLISALVNSIFKELRKIHKKDPMSSHIFKVLNKFIVFFIWGIGIITILSNLGYDISALITGAGIGGLAIALAAQKTVANIFGAISVIINRPFKIGDFIGIGDFSGTVKDIGFTYLTLTSKSGNDILIPNENITSSNIENLSIRDNRRVDMILGLEYSTTNEKMEEAMSILDSIFSKKNENEISDYRIHFDTFGDFSLNIAVTYFSEYSNYKEHIKMVNEINLSIKKQFEEKNIEMAFPTQKIVK